MFKYSDFKCPWIDKKDIWKIADEFFAKYWPEGTLPVDMETIIETRLNLDIIPEQFLLSQLDMDAYLTMDLSGIVVDHDCYMEERFQNRTRFSFAHEVGHLILHKDIYSDISISSPEEWIKFNENVPEKEYKAFEWQANEFAGRLLVPREKLISELKKIRIKIGREQLEYLENDPDQFLSGISPALCRPFGVSDVVVEKRVEREQLWPLY